MEKARGSESVFIYYDKQGRPVDFVDWGYNFDDRFVAEDILDRGKKGELKVRTQYWGHDFMSWRRLPGERPEIYSTDVENGFADHLPRYYASAEEAMAGHIYIKALQNQMLQSFPLRFIEAIRFVIANLKIGAQRPSSNKWAWGSLAMWIFCTAVATSSTAMNFAAGTWGWFWLNAATLWLDLAMLTWTIQGVLFLRKKRHMEKAHAAPQ